MTDHLTADEYHDLVEPKEKKRYEQHEQTLQKACWKHWKNIKMRGWFATARDLSTTSKFEGERKKAMGCVPGLSDMEFWFQPGDARRRLHAEAKDANSMSQARTNMTPAQKIMEPIIVAHGEVFDLFWSAQSFVDMLTRHGIPWEQPRHMMTAEQIDISLNARRAPKKKKAGTGKKRKEGVTAAHKRFQRDMYK